MNRKLFALSMLGVSLAALSGCQHDTAGWRMNYARYSTDRPSPVQEDSIHVEEVSWAAAAHGPIAPGCEMVGEVQPFVVYGRMETVGPDADRSLRPFAAWAGADHVQWAMRPLGQDDVGTSDRWEYRAVLFRTHWDPCVTALRDQDLQ